MSGKTFNGMNFGVYLYLFSENFYDFFSVFYSSSESSFGLVSYENDAAFRTPKVVFEMMFDTSCICHSACRNHYFGSFIFIQSYRFLDCFCEMQIFEVQWIVSVHYEFAGFVVEYFCILAENFRCPCCQRTVDIHRYSVESFAFFSVVVVFVQLIDDFLCPPDCERRDYNCSTAVRSFQYYFDEFVYPLLRVYVKPVS